MQYDVAKLIGIRIKHLPDLSCWARSCMSARDACRGLFQTALQKTFYVVGKHDMILDPYSTACWTNFKNLQLSRVVWRKSSRESFDDIRERSGLPVLSAEFALGKRKAGEDARSNVKRVKLHHFERVKRVTTAQQLDGSVGLRLSLPNRLEVTVNVPRYFTI